MEATMTINSLRVKRRERRKLLAWQGAIFLFIVFIELVGAYFIIYKQRGFMNDALSRTANAFYVLFLRPPKLASIGFIWNPLPSLVQLLIMPFAKYWPGLASMGVAGYITTAVCAGINASLLFGYFKKAGLENGTSLLIVALYALNPFVYYYGLNGMSETIFFTTLIVSVANFALWLDDRATGRLVVIGLLLAVSFLTRYEVFALIAGFGVSLIIAVYWTKDRKSPFVVKPAKMKWDYFVATATMIFLPVMYAILIWMFLNWTIMGDPLHFLNSAYSNESQSAAALWSGFKDQVSNPFSALRYVLVRTVPFLPPFLVITGERIVTKRLLKADYLILIMLVGCLVGFHWLMLLLQKSFGWLRFYSFALITCVAWIPYELGQLGPAMKKTVIVLLCLSLALGAGLVGTYFSDRELAREESFSLVDEDGNRINMQLEVALKINEKYSESTVLIDGFVTSSVILNVKHPENLLNNISRDDFDIAVENPTGMLVDYVVVPTVYTENGYERGGAGTLDAINRAYPSLFRYGASWADLVYDIDSQYRLYKVVYPEENAMVLANLINDEYQDATILLDNSTTGILHKTLKNRKNVITLTSENFDIAIKAPLMQQVEYIIVPMTLVDESGSTDDILRVYPELMAEGTDWTELIYENELYRLFKVIYPEGWEVTTK